MKMSARNPGFGGQGPLVLVILLLSVTDLVHSATLNAETYKKRFDSEVLAGANAVCKHGGDHPPLLVPWVEHVKTENDKLTPKFMFVADADNLRSTIEAVLTTCCDKDKKVFLDVCDDETKQLAVVQPLNDGGKTEDYTGTGGNQAPPYTIPAPSSTAAPGGAPDPANEGGAGGSTPAPAGGDSGASSIGLNSIVVGFFMTIMVIVGQVIPSIY